MESLLTLIRNLYGSGRFAAQLNNPLAQFGLAPANLLGATILPERIVPSNMFTESQIRYKTVIANDGSRYSPAQMKSGGQLVGTFDVKLGDSDIKSELTSEDYDALIDYLGRSQNIAAEATALQFVEREVSQPLRVLCEKQRWDALVDAQVIRLGDNGYREPVGYPDPAGHRVAAAAAWSGAAYDPIPDIAAVHEKAGEKGQQITRIITSTTVVNILLRNQQVKNQARSMGEGQNYGGIVGLPQLNALLASLGFAQIETYNETYNTQEETLRYLKEDAMLFLASTGNTQSVEPREGDPVYLADTLGYTAVGRATGQQTSGRALDVEVKSNKPPRVSFESWQCTLPVVTQPESIYVVNSIR